MDWSKIKYFEPHEWAEDPDRAAPDLVRGLDRARKLAGVPISIHVCWQDGGHEDNSYHYTGQAVDFHFAPGLTTAQELLVLAAQPEIGAIGFYPGWKPRPGWHVDIRDWTQGRIYWVRGKCIYYYGTRALAVAI